MVHRRCFKHQNALFFFYKNDNFESAYYKFLKMKVVLKKWTEPRKEKFN